MGASQQGHGEEGMAQMRQGLAAYRATGAEVFRAYYLALLAEACGRVGQTEEGLHLLAEALTAAHTTGVRFDEAELHRLTGELLLQSGVQGPESAVSTLQAARCTPLQKRRRSVSVRPWRLPVANRRNRWSCGRH
jgi:predicted ATPase